MHNAAKRAACAGCAAVVAILCHVSSYAEEYPFSGIVTEAGVNVRSDATTSASVIMTLKAQERVTVRAKWYGWYKIDLPHRADAFVRADLADLAGDYSVTITKERVNVRRGPSEGSPIIGRASSGDVFTLRRLVKGWYKIVPGNCCTGWVHERFIKKAPPEPEIEVQPVALPPVVAETPLPVNSEPSTQSSRTFDLQAQVSEPLPPANEGTVTVEGIVRFYGKVLGRRARHKLITKDKRTYLLIADAARLDATLYHKVRVSGKPLETTGPYPVLEVVSLEVTDR